MNRWHVFFTDIGNNSGFPVLNRVNVHNCFMLRKSMHQSSDVIPTIMAIVLVPRHLRPGFISVIRPKQDFKTYSIGSSPLCAYRSRLWIENDTFVRAKVDKCKGPMIAEQHREENIIHACWYFNTGWHISPSNINFCVVFPIRIWD